VIKIESGIPMPESTGAGRTPKYPWKEMSVGDSFFDGTAAKTTLASAAYKASRIYGMKYSIRAVDGGVRVWRIK
jgi:hypothetical protein